VKVKNQLDVTKYAVLLPQHVSGTNMPIIRSKINKSRSYLLIVLLMGWFFTFTRSGLGGLGVCMLASGTQDRGFAPDRSRRIFSAEKIHTACLPSEEK
jgi:hypothetical protein